MTDKYEEFKEWLNNLNTEDGVQIRVVEKREWWSVTELFFQYEAEQILQEQEKQREKEVKEILEKHYPSITIDTDFGKQCLTRCSINDCYDELKEKELLR